MAGSQSNQQRRRSFRILVAEDDAISADLIRYALEDAGFHVTITRDGLEAWQKVQDGLFGLIIADVSMPEMHGTELIKRVRALDDYADVPVIFVTAKAFEIDVQDLKIAELFTKPFSPTKLVHTVKKIWSDTQSP